MNESGERVQPGLDLALSLQSLELRKKRRGSENQGPLTFNLFLLLTTSVVTSS